MAECSSLLVLVLYLPLSPAAFHSVYGQHVNEKTGDTDSAMLASVRIDTIPGRLGQEFKEDLEDQINPGNSIPAAAAYRLAVGLTSSEAAIGVSRDGTVSRYNVYLKSTYTLTRIADGKQVSAGSLNHVSSYNNLINAYFSTYVSDADATKRGVSELAELYRTRLAAYFDAGAPVEDKTPIATATPRPTSTTFYPPGSAWYRRDTMKIAPRMAEAYMAKPDSQHRAILFYGPDSGLVRERAKRLVTTLLGEKYDPFALTELTGAQLVADPARLADEIAAISLMAPKRVILISDGGDKLTRIIENAAGCFHDSAFLVICADELSARSSLRGYFEKEHNCAAIACYKDEARDVQEFIRKAFTGANIAVGPGVMEYLSQQLGNDRGVTRQEVEKLILYAGESKQLRLEDVVALVDYNRDTGFDDLANAIANRDLQALEKTLALLLGESASPVAYLRALQRYFNRLYYIKSQMSNGQSAEAVIQGLRPPVFFKQVPPLTRHAQSWSIEHIVKALKLLIAAELACKTSDLPPVTASSRRLMQVAGIR